MFTLILGISMSNAVYAADETCADFIGAIKSNDIKKVFNSYMSGISDMGMVDEAEYRQRFLDAPSEGEQKHGKQWMLQRAYTKCSLSPLSTKLSDVIKVTM
ncbi:hypothetical protein BM525_20525 (plasmid) [Alteromonas mediterranea]|uniref:Uncharacterized protein n=2 Tax=Alteromonas mediterranea TaxID=314275 RepID=A0AAC9JEX0_9ALTE|nr:hypothetical protein BM524_20330 [Alteromonas mediterranea]APE00361.1 hypothetical protein BM525_20525 [Alteromonas mediterranea]